MLWLLENNTSGFALNAFLVWLMPFETLHGCMGRTLAYVVWDSWRLHTPHLPSFSICNTVMPRGPLWIPHKAAIVYSLFLKSLASKSRRQLVPKTRDSPTGQREVEEPWSWPSRADAAPSQWGWCLRKASEDSSVGSVQPLLVSLGLGSPRVPSCLASGGVMVLPWHRHGCWGM